MPLMFGGGQGKPTDIVVTQTLGLVQGASRVSGGLDERCGVPKRGWWWGSVVFVLVFWGDERGRSSKERMGISVSLTISAAGLMMVWYRSKRGNTFPVFVSSDLCKPRFCKFDAPTKTLASDQEDSAI